jgi:NAD(P)-dependent dehydrogenase (short-subunit alcohol dehydrogenase family)
MCVVKPHTLEGNVRRFEGNVAVVTGAAQGIGFAIARRFAQEGATAVIADVNEAGAMEAAQQLREEGLRAVGRGCDVSAKASVDRTFASVAEELGTVHVLVNNAGAASNTLMIDMPETEWRHAMGVILDGTFFCSQAAGRLMKNNPDGGAIVNIASQGAHTTRAGRTHYSVAKAAVVQLTRATAIEFAPFNIRANCISPGGVATGISAWLLKDPVKLEKYLESVPVGRLGQPEEIGAIAAFLASSEAAYMNGAELAVDGGKHALGASAAANRVRSS